jgi:hypothetical protein
MLQKNENYSCRVIIPHAHGLFGLPMGLKVLMEILPFSLSITTLLTLSRQSKSGTFFPQTICGAPEFPVCFFNIFERSG